MITHLNTADTTKQPAKACADLVPEHGIRVLRDGELDAVSGAASMVEYQGLLGRFSLATYYGL